MKEGSDIFEVTNRSSGVLQGLFNFPSDFYARNWWRFGKIRGTCSHLFDTSLITLECFICYCPFEILSLSNETKAKTFWLTFGSFHLNLRCSSLLTMTRKHWVALWKEQDGLNLGWLRELSHSNINCWTRHTWGAPLMTHRLQTWLAHVFSFCFVFFLFEKVTHLRHALCPCSPLAALSWEPFKIEMKPLALSELEVFGPN